jgi:D-alanyl-D-alanine carboxypeptidase (penicillin-binding protein 5/6)
MALVKRARPGQASLLLAALLSLLLVGDSPTASGVRTWVAGPPSARRAGEGSASAVRAGSVPQSSQSLGPVTEPSLAHLGAVSAILENLDTGRILFEKRPDERLPIASLTKIMTAMLVLQATHPSERVRISAYAASQEPTSLGLRTRQRIEVADLLWGLLLHSANDAAVALAEHVAGTARAFDALMNRRASELGMSKTRFASPSGLNDRGYSTARDVAVMTRWAIASSEFDQLVATKRHRVVLPTGSVQLRNLNDLLWIYQGALGVKTGYTRKAGWCLVALARRGNLTLLAVLLRDRHQPFADGAALLDYGFRVAGLRLSVGSRR